MSNSTKKTKLRVIDAAAKGASHIEAVSRSGKWYHYAQETNRWYRVTRRELAELGQLLADGQPDAYSHWCAWTESREMPAGWAP